MKTTAIKTYVGEYNLYGNTSVPVFTSTGECDEVLIIEIDPRGAGNTRIHLCGHAVGMHSDADCGSQSSFLHLSAKGLTCTLCGESIGDADANQIDWLAGTAEHSDDCPSAIIETGIDYPRESLNAWDWPDEQ